MSYHPGPDEWEARLPAQLGLHADGLRAAIEYHQAHESAWPRDFFTETGRYIGVAGEPEAPGDVLGPCGRAADRTASSSAAVTSPPSGATRAGRT